MSRSRRRVIDVLLIVVLLIPAALGAFFTGTVVAFVVGVNPYYGSTVALALWGLGLTLVTGLYWRWRTPRRRGLRGRSSSLARTGTSTATAERTPEALSAEEVADYEQLRRLISPETSLALLDDFAKWLFAIAATVGTLGASFGVSNANKLAGTGKTLFGCAVAAVGISLALTALARLPLSRDVNRYSDVSLSEHVSGVTRVRGRLLTVAALLFALALVLAGLSPLFS